MLPRRPRGGYRAIAPSVIAVTRLNAAAGFTGCVILRRSASRRPRVAGSGGLREIPLDAISGTLEPTRAAQFDGAFRPVSKAARRRWERVWLAEDRGTILPPISVVPVGDGEYALIDGHHRVSVAHARGAVAIDATIAAR